MHAFIHELFLIYELVSGEIEGFGYTIGQLVVFDLLIKLKFY